MPFNLFFYITDYFVVDEKHKENYSVQKIIKFFLLLIYIYSFQKTIQDFKAIENIKASYKRNDLGGEYYGPYTKTL